jgi:hypothetical protein
LPPKVLDLGQTPVGSQIFLDHVGWFVPDMEVASRQFEALGFALTPFVAQHNADPGGGDPVPAGTGNRCAMLQRGYLEVLTAIDGIETPLAQQLNNAVSRYTGLHLIAFTIDDVDAAHGRLEAEGFDPQPPVHLRRPLALAAGGEAEVAFTVLRVPPGAMEEGRIQMLRQETPDLVWQEHLLARDNGIAALAGILLCVDDPVAASQRFASFTGRAAQGDEAYRVIDLDRGRLGFATVDCCRALVPGISISATPFMAAVALQADDPGVIEALCEARNIKLLDDTGDGTVRIDPAAAVGAAMVMFGPDAIWPPDPPGLE